MSSRISKKSSSAILLAVCLSLISTTTWATLLSIVNSSFEAPDCGSVVCTGGSFTSGIIDGWTAASDAGVFDPSLYGPTNGSNFDTTIPDGDQVAYSKRSAISQILSDLLTANTTYTLMVDVGDRNDVNNVGYDIRLFAGGTLLGSVSESDFAVVENGWVTTTLSLTTSAGDLGLGSALRIELDSDGPQANFDYVRLDATAVPEPVTLALLGLGMVGIGFAKRRRT